MTCLADRRCCERATEATTAKGYVTLVGFPSPTPASAEACERNIRASNVGERVNCSQVASAVLTKLCIKLKFGFVIPNYLYVFFRMKVNYCLTCGNNRADNSGK
jgi:hypothetical protein